MIRTHSVVMILPAMLLCGATSSAPTNAASSEGLDDRGLVIRAVGSSFTWRIPCVWCDRCEGQSGHEIGQGGNRDLNPGDPHYGLCVDMGGPYNEQCDEWHESPCIMGEDQEEMASLWTQLAAGIAVEELASRLEASSSRIRFVPQRKAIQFEGCNGLIIANIPLTDSHAAALHTRLLARTGIDELHRVPAS